jgi:hypothetical protein
VRIAFAFAFLMACSSSEAADAPRDASSETTATTCNFNDECPEGQRCNCTIDGCVCEPGARGSGKSGVDSCATGLDCISGVCVEGSSGFVCSGRCADGCGDKLPRCANIAPLGEICVREPPVPATGAKGTFGSNTFEFSSAFFGYDYADGGPVATTIELHAGWVGGCPPPTKDPDATIVVAGVPLPFVATQYESGIKATLLGFNPALPIKSTASSAKVEIRSIEKCPTDVCALDLGVSFVFAEGTVNGPVRATHCDSLDVH